MKRVTQIIAALSIFTTGAIVAWYSADDTVQPQAFAATTCTTDLIRTNNSGNSPLSIPCVPNTPCWRSGSNTYRPADVAFSACTTPSATTTSAPTTTRPPTTTGAPSTTTLAPATTSTTIPTTSTSTTAPTTTSSTTTVPTTTAPGGNNYNTADWLVSAAVPQDMSWEPSGNFRTECRPSHTGTYDPIVYPGVSGAGHLHQFFGNTAIAPDSTYASLRGTGNSTCQGGPLNRTGYWAPAMMNGSGGVVTPEFIIIYYKGEGGGPTIAERQNDIRATQPFPAGLKLVAGYNLSTGASANFYWRCEEGGTQSSTMPSSCGQHLLGTVDFPQCWNGVDLDSANHRSHMAYKGYDPSTGAYKCPSGYPVQLPHLTEIFYYPAGNYSGWSVSSDAMAGKVRGQSFHADWFGAWDPAIMNRWLNSCIRQMRNGVFGNLCDGQALKP